jgi:hypothetical protein
VLEKQKYPEIYEILELREFIVMDGVAKKIRIDNKPHSFKYPDPLYLGTYASCEDDMMRCTDTIHKRGETQIHCKFCGISPKRHLGTDVHVDMMPSEKMIQNIHEEEHLPTRIDCDAVQAYLRFRKLSVEVVMEIMDLADYVSYNLLMILGDPLNPKSRNELGTSSVTAGTS